MNVLKPFALNRRVAGFKPFFLLTAVSVLYVCVHIHGTVSLVWTAGKIMLKMISNIITRVVVELLSCCWCFGRQWCKWSGSRLDRVYLSE